MPDAVLLAPIAVAAALVVAGAAKLRAPAAAAAAFDELDVPRALSRPWMRRSLPWLEIVLGIGLLLLPAPYVVVPAVLAVLATAAYLLLVVRVLGAGRTVDCACFGGLAGSAVGVVTAVRNLVLLGAAVLALVAGLAGTAVVTGVPDLDADGVAWLLGALGLAVVVALVLHRTPDDAGPERRGIPYLPVTHADGATTTLPELASQKAVLLVHLSDTCNRCERITRVIADWPEQVPQIDVRVLAPVSLDGPLPAAWPGVVHDTDGRVAAVLGLARPSAVLLGADALLAAGPVHGPSAVLDLFAEVRASLAAEVDPGVDPGDGTAQPAR